MLFVVLTYIFFLLIFFGVSAVILHHTFKFGYLAPKFRVVAGIFVLLSVIVIIYSLFLLLTLDSTPSSPEIRVPTRSSSELNF